VVNKTDLVRRFLKDLQSTAKDAEWKLFKRFQKALNEATTDAERLRIIEKADKRFPGFKDGMENLGLIIFATQQREKATDRIIKMLDDESLGMSDFAVLPPIDGITALTLRRKLKSHSQSGIAKKPRKHKPTCRSVTIEAMRTARIQGQSLDDFLDAAEAGSIDGLTISMSDGVRPYVVSATEVIDEQPAAESTLREWWTASGKQDGNSGLAG